ncbi:MAG: DNA repair protein RecO, partial [Pygmaiobacter sp.]
MQIKTTGLVLREVKTGEADRILTILTPDYGVISASAKSSMRLKSKLFAATGLFCYSEFLLFEGKTMYSVDEASATEVFFGLRGSIEGMSLAMYLAELTITLSPEGESAQTLLRLLLNSLHLISEQKKPIEQIKTVFELRALSDAGFMPDIVGCKYCGGYQTNEFLFNLQEGDLLCATCAKQQGIEPNITRSELSAMQHILYSKPDKIYGFTLLSKTQKHLSALASGYVCYQLDH